MEEELQPATEQEPNAAGFVTPSDDLVISRDAASSDPSYDQVQQRVAEEKVAVERTNGW